MVFHSFKETRQIRLSVLVLVWSVLPRVRLMLFSVPVMLLVLPILLEVTPFALLRPREGASQGPSGLASFCMSQLVHVTTREFSNQVPLLNMDQGMIRYLFWSQFGSQKSNSQNNIPLYCLQCSSLQSPIFLLLILASLDSPPNLEQRSPNLNFSILPNTTLTVVLNFVVCLRWKFDHVFVFLCSIY